MQYPKVLLISMFVCFFTQCPRMHAISGRACGRVALGVSSVGLGAASLVFFGVNRLANSILKHAASAPGDIGTGKDSVTYAFCFMAYCGGGVLGFAGAAGSAVCAYFCARLGSSCQS